MGMLFGGWAREEEDEYQADFKQSGISYEDWKAKKEDEYNNKNLSYYKRVARFKGIELNEGDMICKDLNGDMYVINDFQEDGRPICTLVSIEKHDFYKQPYPFEEFQLIGTKLI